MALDVDDPWGDEPDWVQAEADVTENGADGVQNDEWVSTGGMNYGAQHIVVLIDCSPSMFIPSISLDPEEEEETQNDNEGNFASSDEDSCDGNLVSPFDAALMACERLLLHRVHHVATNKTGKRNGVGAILYNVPPASRGMRAIRKSGQVHRTSSSPMDVDNESVSNQKIKSEGGDDTTGYNTAHEEEEENDDDDKMEDEEDYEADLSFSSTSVLVDLASPGIDQIQTVRSCLIPQHYSGRTTKTKIVSSATNRRKRDLEKDMYGGKSPGDDSFPSEYENGTMSGLRSALCEANKAFANASCVKKIAQTSKQPHDSKTIWILTNSDDPTKGNKTEKDRLLITAKDTVDNGLDICLWPLPMIPSFNALSNNSHQAFDRSKLYDQITTIQDGFLEGSEADMENYFDLDSMLDIISIQWKRVRKFETIPLLLPDWNICDDEDYPGIMLDLFCTVAIKTRPTPVTISGSTKKRTIRKTRIISKETGEHIEDKNRIRLYTEFGGEPVPITQEEVANMRKISNICPDRISLVLLGFKPKPEEISEYPIIEKPYLAYPNDSKVVGSRKAFTALHESMMRKNVIGIGELLLKTNFSSRLVAIIPETNPPGFILVPLGFEDDVRAIPVDCNIDADDETVHAAMDLIRNQNIDNGFEVGEMFENPVLKLFWNFTEKIALEMPLTDDDDTGDDTEMNVEGILESAGAQIEAFKSMLPDEEIGSVPRKRKLKS